MTTANPKATPVAPTPPQTASIPAQKKAPVRKTPARKAGVKKVVVKKPLSKAFAPTKTTKPVKTVKVAKAAKAVKTVKAEKPKKPKLVRDSFTIPKAEYLVIDALKQRAAKLTRSIKKSELLRAGIKALAALSDTAFLSALEKVPTIKTGRPASAK